MKAPDSRKQQTCRCQLEFQYVPPPWSSEDAPKPKSKRRVLVLYSGKKRGDLGHKTG